MIDVARLLLATVFAVAGALKLLDLDGSRRAARAFGAPGWLGVVLPVVELGISVALVPASTARAAAVAAAALLVVFAIVVANALLRGRKPDCGCLGRLYSSQANWWTVGRNVALAALALAITSQPAGALSWVELAVAGAAIALAAQTILSVTLLRRYGRALARIEELAASPASPAEPQVEPAPQPATNARPNLATAAALAGGIVVTTAVAQAAPPTDPELNAIYEALRTGGQKLVAAAERSRRAMRDETGVLKGKALRARRSATRTALAAERREVLALRTLIKGLPESTSTAHNVKAMIHRSLTLRVQSLDRHRRAVGAAPKTARKLLTESQRLFARSLGSMMVAGKTLQESK